MNTVEARLAEARRHLDTAYAACLAAQASLVECERWQAELSAVDLAPARRAVRAPMIASCQALAERRREELKQRQQALQQALTAIEEQQRELALCQKALLRTEQWQMVEQQAASRASIAQENRQDEEWSAGHAAASAHA
jgi:hypothetical protein